MGVSDGCGENKCGKSRLFLWGGCGSFVGGKEKGWVIGVIIGSYVE